MQQKENQANFLFCEGTMNSEQQHMSSFLTDRLNQEQERLTTQRRDLQARMHADMLPATRLLHCPQCQAVCWFAQENEHYWGCLDCLYGRELIETLDTRPSLRIYRGVRIRKSGKASYTYQLGDQRITVAGLDAARIEIDSALDTGNHRIYTHVQWSVRSDRTLWRCPEPAEPETASAHILPSMGKQR